MTRNRRLPGPFHFRKRLMRSWMLIRKWYSWQMIRRTSTPECFFHDRSEPGALQTGVRWQNRVDYFRLGHTDSVDFQEYCDKVLDVDAYRLAKLNLKRQIGRPVDFQRSKSVLKRFLTAA